MSSSSFLFHPVAGVGRFRLIFLRSLPLRSSLPSRFSPEVMGFGVQRLLLDVFVGGGLEVTKECVLTQ